MNAKWFNRTGINILRIRLPSGSGALCERWIELRPKLGVYDVKEYIGPHWRPFPRIVLRTPDLFAAVSSVLELGRARDAQP